MQEQQIDLELEPSESEHTEEDLENATDWLRSCIFFGM
jgi:hypothetical protein